MFEGFTDEHVDVGEVALRVRHGGGGPPVLLVHGHPRTGSTWHSVAPRLVEAGYSVVVPDMRGYGQSGKVEIEADHSQQSKRAVANDLARLMEILGHTSYAVVGHDRGAYVALRLALEHAERVDRLVVMDAIPIIEHLDRCDARFARAWYHWFWFDVPEDWVRAVTDPGTVRAMLEDYRAGLGVDATHEREDREAGRRVVCPTLMLWSSEDDLVEMHGDPLPIWREWCVDVHGGRIESGHHMAEENPEALAAALTDFLGH